MLDISKTTENYERLHSSELKYTEIKPIEEMTAQDARDYWDMRFEGEKGLEHLFDDYMKDLKDKSACPDTISERYFVISDLKRIPPELNAEQRVEFVEKKADLKREWETINGRPWPKYESDVYSANGKLIRRAGSDYDAHHIHPLGMGGKNEALNLTPIHAELHYDKQGVHAPDSPYSKIDSILGGAN